MYNTKWYIDENFKKEKRGQTIRIVVSTILGIIGLTLVISQGLPLAASFLQGKFIEIQANNIIRPTHENEEQYIKGEFAYFDPGTNYFQNISKQVETTLDRETFINTEYKKNMSLTIESVGIHNINVSSNVESKDEDVYNQYLTKGLAHFKGTPLPGDNGNSFIYGHSAVTSFFNSNPNLPETIFTRLENIDIGDTVEVKKDDQIFKYTIRNKKIIDPDDFSIFDHNSHKETLTLMTCWPIGIGSKRLIVVGELND